MERALEPPRMISQDLLSGLTPDLLSESLRGGAWKGVLKHSQEGLPIIQVWDLLVKTRGHRGPELEEPSSSSGQTLPHHFAFYMQ